MLKHEPVKVSVYALDWRELTADEDGLVTFRSPYPNQKFKVILPFNHEFSPAMRWFVNRAKLVLYGLIVVAMFTLVAFWAAERAAASPRDDSTGFAFLIALLLTLLYLGITLGFMIKSTTTEIKDASPKKKVVPGWNDNQVRLEQKVHSMEKQIDNLQQTLEEMRGQLRKL